VTICLHITDGCFGDLTSIAVPYSIYHPTFEDTLSLQSHECYFRATLDAVWAVLTQPDQIEAYFFGTRVRSDWKTGSSIAYTLGDGGPLAVEGQIQRIEPKSTLDHFWTIHYDPTLSDEVSKVSYTLTPMGEAVQVVVTHDFNNAPKTQAHLQSMGWGFGLSSLKSYLETGKAWTPPAPQ
jgi:uncharacterized protein YndB with AHSA1/START domain